MKTIRSIRSFARRLRNAEHFDLYVNVVNHLGSITLRPAALQPLWEALAREFDCEDRIYKRYLRKEETRRVNSAHRKRKKACMALKLAVGMGLYGDAPQVEEAARSLKVILDNYADVNRSPMTETSAMIVNLAQDIRLPQYAAAIALLPGAGDAITRLERANELFMNLYYERASGWEDERDAGSLAAARVRVDRQFASLTNAINIYYQANEMQPSKDPGTSETLGGIIHSINSYIRQYEMIYSRRNPRYQAPAAGDTLSLPDDNPGGDSHIADARPEAASAAQELPDANARPASVAQELPGANARPASVAQEPPGANARPASVGEVRPAPAASCAGLHEATADRLSPAPAIADG
jgi:hypothetical protein